MYNDKYIIKNIDKNKKDNGLKDNRNRNEWLNILITIWLGKNNDVKRL